MSGTLAPIGVFQQGLITVAEDCVVTKWPDEDNTELA